MTELQKNFLVFTAVFFAVQIVIFVVFYIVLIMNERRAKVKKAYLRELYLKRRKEQMEKWHVAYKRLSEKNSKRSLEE